MSEKNFLAVSEPGFHLMPLFEKEKTDSLPEPELFVDVMPHFPGGTDAMYKFISENLRYPEEEKKNGIEGTSIAQFIVETDGTISTIKVIRGANEGFNTEVIRILNSMNSMPEKWSPGKKEGRNVRVAFTLPFKFKIEAEHLVPPPPPPPMNLDDNKSEDGVFTYVEEMPRFPGCEDIEPSKRAKCSIDAMYKYLASKIVYPESDKKAGIHGMVIVQFVVGSDGTISQTVIKKSVSSAIDAEALKVVNSMNSMPQKWIPARHNGRTVSIIQTLPITFTIPDK